MGADQDDASFKARIAHAGHGHKELAGQLHRFDTQSPPLDCELAAPRSQVPVCCMGLTGT
jgi:hypothetical protein